ncbi:zinc metalloprotease [Croceicoccus estronivorus]|uniref:KPN_02809 family neutral zinc metallopeptidase n=1 Tax=Croceicoccus estronivorus TaxID=1172626 RepID=UPI00082EE2CF|nr:neutral zinc metallopeptidase [Croceicoccus estronivorus]OCC23227.1 zinc metalloprotease [Croceicoccus estronivorus]
MRLKDFNPRNIRVEDQRGSGGGSRFPGGGGGKLGIVAIVVALAISYFTGIDVTQLLGGLQQAGEQTASTGSVQQAGTNAEESCNADALSRESCAALASLNETWEPLFTQAGVPFSQPKLVFYSQSGQSGCGAAQSAMGPFYCPSDRGIYIDTDFYREMEQRLGAGGDFARAYVMAHEYGHHVQALTGLADQVRRAQQRNPDAANQLQVRMELQADCYAGVWAAKNRNLIEPGDIEEGLNAAHQIGDDTLMRNAGRRPVEEAFTHGSSAQRKEWLRRGIETGNEDMCDTFSGMKQT